MAEALQLNDKVFFCIAQGQGVFLDLAQDAYSAVPIPAELFDPEGQITESQLVLALAPYRADLLSERLLKLEPSHGPGFFAYQAIPRASTSILFPYDDRAFGLCGGEAKAVRVRFREVFDFFLATRRAAHLLKKKHIRTIVEAVGARKAAKGQGPVDLAVLRRETAIFAKLRPWYPRTYLCLWDALALIEFLARRRHFPTWIFGVQAQPFGAHCWIQEGEVLLNEGSEYAGQFKPIMAV